MNNLDVLISIRSVEEFAPTNIWVSLQTKEQFIERASKLIQREVGPVAHEMSH